MPIEDESDGSGANDGASTVPRAPLLSRSLLEFVCCQQVDFLSAFMEFTLLHLVP